MKTTAESGNYIVAKEAIRAGDTLIAEQPLAACLLPKYYGSHCLHCFKRYALNATFDTNAIVVDFKRMIYDRKVFV